ncbi:hypothetical protein key_060 [Erwinia phage KEY]|uniref:Uncharacterized protein n=1 Tax=Erwinia phage KEY TaxID=2821255 RepID=A0AAE8BE53_9CAUD|nr:hypothetical protein key_060 [Erwinia phage KEY]
MSKFILDKDKLVGTSYSFLINDLEEGELKEIPLCTSDNGLLFYNWCIKLGLEENQSIWVRNL